MSKEEKIIIGADHRGFILKNGIVNHLRQSGYEIDDVGCNSIDSCDYPEYGHIVSKKVRQGDGLGILICGTGIGMSIVANRTSNIRAAMCFNEYMAKMSRMHNNANVLVLGASIIGLDLALEIVNTWINTEFEGGRHQKRVDMMDEI